MSPHAILDVVVDDEVQLLVGEAVVLGQDAAMTLFMLVFRAYRILAERSMRYGVE